MKKFSNEKFERAVSQSLGIEWNAYSGIDYNQNLSRDPIPAWNRDIGSPWNKGRTAWNKGLIVEYKPRTPRTDIIGKGNPNYKGVWLCGEYGEFNRLDDASKVVGKAPSTIAAWCRDPNKNGWELKKW
jgi:hypothetical protein